MLNDTIRKQLDRSTKQMTYKTTARSLQKVSIMEEKQVF